MEEDPVGQLRLMTGMATVLSEWPALPIPVLRRWPFPRTISILQVEKLAETDPFRTAVDKLRLPSYIWRASASHPLQSLVALLMVKMTLRFLLLCFFVDSVVHSQLVGQREYHPGFHYGHRPAQPPMSERYVLFSNIFPSESEIFLSHL